MSVLVPLIIISLVAAVAALGAFVAAVRSGQFDDLSSPAERMLRDSGRASTQEGDAP